MAAGYVQQRGDYSFADRFNALSIYFFSMTIICAGAAIFHGIFAVVFDSRPLMFWFILFAVLALLAWKRWREFARFFAKTVMTAFVVLATQESRPTNSVSPDVPQGVVS